MKITRTLLEKSGVMRTVSIIVEVVPEFFQQVLGSLREYKVRSTTVIGPMGFIALEDVPSEHLEKIASLTGVEMVHYDQKVRYFGPFGFMDALANGIRPRDFIVAKDFNLFSILNKSRAVRNEIGTKKLVELSHASELQYDGSGTKVCVVDTGISIAHPAFAGKKVKSLHISRFGIDSLVDSNGHGTFVSAAVVGKEVTSVKGIKCSGISNAQLVSVKALRTPFGISRSSDILKAIEVGQREGVKVYSMSLGSAATEPYTIDPVCKVITYLTNGEKKIFVVAAGNDGPDAGTINSPGHCKEALTVGSCNMQESASEFSSRGPTIDGLIKPDVVFFGGESDGKELIHGPTSPRSVLDPSDGYVAVIPRRAYASLVGTSMATPFVAGIIARWNDYYMAKYNREITRSDIESIIKKGTKNNNIGYGRIDAKWIR